MPGALDLSKLAIAADPTYSEGYRLLAAGLRGRGDLVAAREMANQDLRLAPASVSLHALLGLIAVDAKDYARAEAVFRRALGLDPMADIAAWLAFWLGRTRAEQDRLDEAIYVLQAAHSLAPDDQLLLLSLGEVRVHQGNYEEAIPLLTEIVTRQPEHAQGHYLLAFSLGRLGQWEEAAQEAKRAVELEPNVTRFTDYSLLANHEAAFQRNVREIGN